MKFLQGINVSSVDILREFDPMENRAYQSVTIGRVGLEGKFFESTPSVLGHIDCHPTNGLFRKLDLGVLKLINNLLTLLLRVLPHRPINTLRILGEFQ